MKILFTPELRLKTQAAIALAFLVATLEKPPRPLTGKLTVRCTNCSMAPLCLPDEVKLLRSKKGSSRANTLPE